MGQNNDTQNEIDSALIRNLSDISYKSTDDAELFECCASYIEESFKDWNLKMPPVEIKKSLKEDIKFNDDLCDNSETSYDGKLNFNGIKSKLSKDRATFDLFSSKADDYNADSVIKVMDTNINRFDGKGYGIKYLLDCLKVDNEEY